MKQQRGAALLLALGYLAALTLFASSFYTAVHRTADGERSADKAQQAYNLAEAGIDWAIVQLRNNDAYPGEDKHRLGEGRFKVVVERGENASYVVRSTGELLDGEMVIGEANLRARIALGPGGSVRSYTPLAPEP